MHIHSRMCFLPLLLGDTSHTHCVHPGEHERLCIPGFGDSLQKNCSDGFSLDLPATPGWILPQRPSHSVGNSPVYNCKSGVSLDHVAILRPVFAIGAMSLGSLWRCFVCSLSGYRGNTSIYVILKRSFVSSKTRGTPHTG